MNDEQHAYWEKYLRFLADMLMLRDWDIHLERDRPENGQAWAHIWVAADAKHAFVRLAWPEWFAISKERQRHYCIHELIHCHWYPIDARLNEYQSIIDGGDAMKLVRAQIKSAIEFASDDIARAFANHLAPPEDAP